MRLVVIFRKIYLCFVLSGSDRQQKAHVKANKLSMFRDKFI
jgi:hypothetical protein